MKQSEILKQIREKLGIVNLNEMQKKMLDSMNSSSNDIVLLSPTGSGKTLAFLIPLLQKIKPGSLQLTIIAPSRELVIQIYEIARAIAYNCKVSVCYGGHNAEDEKNSLSVVPDIIIATPGRLLDHTNRKNIDLYNTRYLVLDEFDKSLELGFSDEMERLIKRMPNIARRVLTSATALDEYPEYLRINQPVTISYLGDNEELRTRLRIMHTVSESKDKLQTLFMLLCNISDKERCMVFLNHRDAVERVYEFLKKNNVPVGLYHGGMEQSEREKAIAMFNNGTFSVLVTTDLGARGLDIADVAHIIHYHLPVDKATFTHRNGRTARITASGMVHIITSEDERLPEYIDCDGTDQLRNDATLQLKPHFSTLYFKAGKKEKISKGDIVGFLTNNADIKASEIGIINNFDHYTLVAVPFDKAKEILKKIAPLKIKNKKIKIDFARQ